ncbi:MAG: hypothetical protein US13_C0002G0188 [candidate division TM6 bacterium GW2011_GWE2_36_25]|nr:MAG: hypothetical protein US03_C0002G0189 [candidate division TM6 bacterium GW2011_GWF2_36_131]KKQ03622.1 MAG: hypothetical protein US13_C0002G0188 [candidate division TM6 bacterium GW2011_GWE2_36_25]
MLQNFKEINMKLIKATLAFNLLVISSIYSITKKWEAGDNLAIKFQSSTNFQLPEEERVQIAAHVPGFKDKIKENYTQSLVINHIYIQREQIKLTHQDNRITIKSPWRDNLPEDFIHLLYGAARLQWLKNKTFPVHSACIGTDKDGYILLVGPSNSGKTSLMLKSIENHEFKVFSGDKTLVKFENSNLVAIAGTRTITTLKEEAPRWSSIPKEKEYTLGTRIIFQLPSSYYTNLKRVPIRQIFFVKLNDGRCIDTQFNSLSALHSLFPIFLDKHREDVLLGADQELLNGNVKKKIKKYLAQKLYESLKKIETYNIVGSLNDVTNFIKNKYQSLSLEKTSHEKINPKNIVVGVCGIGNGHCNRQLPIISTLLEQNHQITILTYGDGLSFFKNKFGQHKNVTIILVANPYFVGCPQGLDFEKTALSSKNNVDFNHINSQAMHLLSQKIGTPDLVISDYEMVAAQYAYAKQVPLLTLDQQSKYLVGKFEATLNKTSYIDEIERLNLFFPLAAKRIATSFFKVEKINNKEVEVLPSILKNDIVQAKNHPLSKHPSLLLYITSQQLVDFPLDEWIQVLKSALPEHFEVHCFLPKQLELPQDKPRIYFYHHGKMFNECLFKAHGIITTAGHTLLSEAMYLEKPVYAIPLPLYEQQLNAHIIAEGKFGICDKTLTATSLQTFIENLEQYKKNIQNDTMFLFKENGHDSIIKEINKMLKENI